MLQEWDCPSARGEGNFGVLDICGGDRSVDMPNAAPIGVQPGPTVAAGCCTNHTPGSNLNTEPFRFITPLDRLGQCTFIDMQC